MHSGDDGIAALAGELLDSVESQKKADDDGGDKEANDVEEGTNHLLTDILSDKDVSISYVLNFADKIFNNSLKQITEKRSAKSTGFDLLASVTFYDLLKLWDDYENLQYLIDPGELNKRKKYAKYHAARILKALKSGENPNDYTSPENEVKQADDEDSEDNNTPEAKTDELGLPSVSTALPGKTKDKKDSLEQLPSENNEDDDMSSLLPSAPSFKPAPDPPVQDLDPDLEEDGSDLGLPSAPPNLPEIPHAKPTSKKKAPVSSPPPPAPVQKALDVGEIIESNEIYTKAQRHARFAMSAMNYEDKETSIAELEAAIKLLNKLRT